MAAAFPIVLDRWPAGRPVWIAAEDGLRHWVPAWGGVMGICSKPLPVPPVMAFPDPDESCCPRCLRLAMDKILPTLARMP